MPNRDDLRWARAATAYTAAPIRRVQGRWHLTLTGHVILPWLVLAALLTPIVLYGLKGAGPSLGAAVLLYNPTARSAFALIGWFPVKLHSAVGDGTTDDMPALALAGAAAEATGGGLVVLGATRNSAGYRVVPGATSLAVTSDVSVRGCGSKSKLLVLDGDYPETGSGGLITLPDENGPSYENVSCEGVWIEGPGRAPTDPGDFAFNAIRLFCDTSPQQHNDRFRIVNCTIVNWPGTCVYLNNARDFHVDGNTLTTPGRAGIILWSSCDGGTLQGNIVNGAGDDCIALNASTTSIGSAPKNIVISGNQLYNLGDPAMGNRCIASRGGRDLTITGNHCYYAHAGALAGVITIEGDTGADTFLPENVLVTANHVYGGLTNGIAVVAPTATRVWVTGNHIYDVDNHGILVQMSPAGGTFTDILVDGNYVHTAGAAEAYSGIQVTTGATGTLTHLSIKRNEVNSPAGHGIYVNPNAAITTTSVDVCDNRVRNAHRVDEGGTVDSIRLHGTVSHFEVTGNRAYNTTGTPTRYGIGLDATGTTWSNGTYDRNVTLATQFSTAGYNLPAASMGAGFYVGTSNITGGAKAVYVKTADQTLTQSSTTLQNVTDLAFPVRANEIWFVELFWTLNGASLNADWKFDINLPAGATKKWNLGTTFAGVAVGGTPAVMSTGSLLAGGNAGDTMLYAAGWVTIGATAGTAQAQAAQNTAQAEDNKVLKGTLMRLTPAS